MSDEIPIDDILRFLAQHQGRWCTHGQGYSMPTVQDAVPAGTPPETQLAWMRQLLADGWVQGCGCGCRGDWEATNRGLQRVGLPRTAATVPRIVEGAFQIDTAGLDLNQDSRHRYMTVRYSLNGGHEIAVGDVMPSSGTPTAPAG